MEMMEAEITIDADVHSEIVVWAPGWDNSRSAEAMDVIRDRLLRDHPDSVTEIITDNIIQSNGGMRFEKVNRSTLFIDFRAQKKLISTDSQYTEENRFRRETEDELTALYEGFTDAYRVNTRMKVRSKRELRLAV